MTDKNKDPSLEACFTEVGRIAHDFSCAELTMDFLIWELAGVSPTLGTCITSFIGAAQTKINIIESLLKERDAPKNIIDKLNRFSEKSRELSKIRARLVHDMWMTAEDYPDKTFQIRFTVDNKKKVKFGPDLVTLEELQEIHKRAKAHAQELINIRTAMGTWLASSLEKYSAQQTVQFVPRG